MNNATLRDAYPIICIENCIYSFENWTMLATGKASTVYRQRKSTSKTMARLLLLTITASENLKRFHWSYECSVNVLGRCRCHLPLCEYGMYSGLLRRQHGLFRIPSRPQWTILRLPRTFVWDLYQPQGEGSQIPIWEGWIHPTYFRLVPFGLAQHTTGGVAKLKRQTMNTEVPDFVGLYTIFKQFVPNFTNGTALLNKKLKRDKRKVFNTFHKNEWFAVTASYWTLLNNQSGSTEK